MEVKTICKPNYGGLNNSIKTLRKMKNIRHIILGLSLILVITSCEKSDPFVDRVVSPVLVQVMGDNGLATSGLTTDPTIGSSFGETANMSVMVLELDKTNILDYTKGIDSIPATSIELIVKFRGGAEIGKFTTDGSGVASVSVPWITLGISGPGNAVPLSVSGTYKDVAFTKIFKLSAN
ncbi:MAG: hypothetical protein ACI9DJ_000752 [Algoriphagus sp.]|jgi:hypothetical protein